MENIASCKDLLFLHDNLSYLAHHSKTKKNEITNLKQMLHD